MPDGLVFFSLGIAVSVCMPTRRGWFETRSLRRGGLADSSISNAVCGRRRRMTPWPTGLDRGVVVQRCLSPAVRPVPLVPVRVYASPADETGPRWVLIRWKSASVPVNVSTLLP